MLRISIYHRVLRENIATTPEDLRRGRGVDAGDVALACGTREYSQTRIRGTVGNLVDPLHLSRSCPEGSRAREKCLRVAVARRPTTMRTCFTDG
ncbi:unnamed protein product [Lasius platythorax]|uniref:Uncharacterized protein n=1 Tax=Lasius platythorax TaxID=488582 RepID=A0AAV2P1Z5_9HYME